MSKYVYGISVIIIIHFILAWDHTRLFGNVIVRIEFSPVVKINASKGYILLQENVQGTNSK